MDPICLLEPSSKKIFLSLKFKLNSCLTAPLQSKSTPFKSIFSSSLMISCFIVSYLEDHEIVKRSQTYTPTHICIHRGKKRLEENWAKFKQGLFRYGIVGLQFSFYISMMFPKFLQLSTYWFYNQKTTWNRVIILLCPSVPFPNHNHCYPLHINMSTYDKKG